MSFIVSQIVNNKRATNSQQMLRAMQFLAYGVKYVVVGSMSGGWGGRRLQGPGRRAINLPVNVIN